MAPPSRKVVSLDTWEFKQADQDDSHFLACAQFPTNIHLDLLKHKMIPDPFMGKNELDVQWVGEKAWTYRTRFKVAAAAGHQFTELSFEGLDTFATVTLDGVTILESDNMFIPYRVDVTPMLAASSLEAHELRITFKSAYLEGWKLVEAHPQHKWGCWNGDVSRLAVRKAQYHWGWDWGPTLLTCGPWRPINLEVYSSRISDLWFAVEVPDEMKSATVEAFVKIDGAVMDGVATTGGLSNGMNALDMVRFDVFLEDERVASGESKILASGAYAHFHIPNPRFWYPIRHGAQPLYTITATLFHHGKEQDTVTKRVGLRRVELVQRPLDGEDGTSFFFKVNNIPIFCGGSNWIPADSFIPRIKKEDYRSWVKLVADGNQNMIRVWGGGIYEEQDFYDACDELGILVWQDFMFGCGNYPVWDELVHSIRAEAVANLRRLRHHPCMVIWAGNNEDYQYQESEGLTYKFEDKEPKHWLETDFPARYIYEEVLAKACQDEIPSTYYHFGSPWGGGKNTQDPTVGDIHQWNVWHGTQEKYQDFDKLGGRFVSEFGMEAFPHLDTIDAYLPLGAKDPDRYAQSSTVDFHNKAAGHERRLALYLAENIRYTPEPLEDYVYFTQVMQAECLSSAYRLWKRQWKGPEKEFCAGALVWQINDCWPVTSWSICDYNKRPKMAYYAIKRELADVTVGIKRTEHRQAASKHTRLTETETRAEFWACNMTMQEVRVKCVVRAWDLETSDEIVAQRTEGDVTLLPNRSTEILAWDLWANARSRGKEAKTVILATLVSLVDGETLARHVDWPQPLKYCHFPAADDLRPAISADRSYVEVCSKSAVKALELKCDGVDFEDNCVDLAPGIPLRVRARGLRSDTRINSSHIGISFAK